MTGNGWVRRLLADEIRWRTNLPEKITGEIVDGFMENLDNRRRTIMPTYLDDDMYGAQLRSGLIVDYGTASLAYRAIVTEYGSRTYRCPEEDEPGRCW